MNRRSTASLDEKSADAVHVIPVIVRQEDRVHLPGMDIEPLHVVEQGGCVGPRVKQDLAEGPLNHARETPSVLETGNGSVVVVENGYDQWGQSELRGCIDKESEE